MISRDARGEAGLEMAVGKMRAALNMLNQICLWDIKEMLVNRYTKMCVWGGFSRVEGASNVDLTLGNHPCVI